MTKKKEIGFSLTKVIKAIIGPIITAGSVLGFFYFLWVVPKDSTIELLEADGKFKDQKIEELSELNNPDWYERMNNQSTYYERELYVKDSIVGYYKSKFDSLEMAQDALAAITTDTSVWILNAEEQKQFLLVFLAEEALRKKLEINEELIAIFQEREKIAGQFINELIAHQSIKTAETRDSSLKIAIASLIMGVLTLFSNWSNTREAFKYFSSLGIRKRSE